MRSDEAVNAWAQLEGKGPVGRGMKIAKVNEYETRFGVVVP